MTASISQKRWVGLYEEEEEEEGDRRVMSALREGTREGPENKSSRGK